MSRVFNVTGSCNPARHYMVDPEPRLIQIKRMIAAGDYFSINRARQYGKTTTLRALANYLRNDYVVVSLDFQKMTTKDFSSEARFVRGLAREINKATRHLPAIPAEQAARLKEIAADKDDGLGLTEIFDCFSEWCGLTDKPVVLLIDEVDTASNNQVFLDFLALLRAYYLDRDVTPAFQSVILAGLYDIRNVRRKIRPDEEHKQNSPWNIAADYNVEMGFSSDEIAAMLGEYEADYYTGMNIGEMADLIYSYTSGYPYLVSRLCKFLDEKVAGSEGYPDKSSAWTKKGFQEAVKLILNETNTLYQSLIGKVRDYPALKSVLYDLLFAGKPTQYNALNEFIEIAAMFGFVKDKSGFVEISNRIFETVLYNWFISEESMNSQFYNIGAQEKNQFIAGGHLNVRLILERFVESFHDLYKDRDDMFLEDVGRRYFLLFLKPIINGTGNYYVEARTRNQKRTDLVIDYLGEQFVIELKIWHGNSYNQRGENQLAEYLDYFHLKKGYMLSFNFNQKKQIGVKEIQLGEKVLFEAVV